MSIVINERDLSKVNVGNYKNFTVVVPGWIATGKGSGFDTNHIAEITTQSEFDEKVGKVKRYTPAVIAKAPTISDTIEPSATSGAEKWSEWHTAKKPVYIKTAGTAEAPINEDGKLKVKKTEGNYGCFYTLETVGAEYIQTNSYAYIKEGDEGVDGNAEVTTSYGNEIAYRLLGLGYTVLYVDISDGTSSETSHWATAKEALTDKSLYDFRYICTGGVDTINDGIITLANTRMDCIALPDILESTYENKTSAEAVKAIKALSLTASKYAAYIVPYVNYADSIKIEAYDNIHFPGSFHYLVCAAQAFQNFNEWYAVAGYARGIGSYVISSATVKFGDAAVAALCPRSGSGSAVNPIIWTKNNGYIIWGNRTAYTLTTELLFSHFLNIRQLLCTLKKQIYIACKQFTFDPNSDILWTNFCNAIRPTLDKMKADQGIKNYKIVKVANEEKAKLKALIRIVPIEAVEDFDVTITLEDNLEGNLDPSIVE